MAHGVYYYESS